VSSCSSWSVFRTHVARASRRCRKGCSNGSGSPRRWSASRSSCSSDEPTSALDPAGRRVVRELLEELRRRGTSVLLNSHLLSEVELVCDHVVIVDHGRVVAAGTPSELRREGGVEVKLQRASGRSLKHDARTSRAWCATSSRPATTSSASASSPRRSKRRTSRSSTNDRDRPLRAAREPAAEDVRCRARAHGRVPRALRLGSPRSVSRHARLRGA